MSSDELMAFGDANNDKDMLELMVHSYQWPIVVMPHFLKLRIV